MNIILHDGDANSLDAWHIGPVEGVEITGKELYALDGGDRHLLATMSDWPAWFPVAEPTYANAHEFIRILP